MIDVFLNAMGHHRQSSSADCKFGGSIRRMATCFIAAQAQYSGQTTIVFQESPDLLNWQNATDGLNPTLNGPIYTSEFPLGAKQMYYRVVYQPLGPQH